MDNKKNWERMVKRIKIDSVRYGPCIEDEAIVYADQRIADLEAKLKRYEFLRDEDAWGEDKDSAWQRLGEANGTLFDDIVDAQMEQNKDWITKKGG